MERQLEPHFTTGEFTRVLGVRKHTPFHYNGIGLFSPALKGGNGYRYYLVWQVDVFEVIRALQKLGIPLGKVKEHMEGRPLEHFMSMMDGKRHQIDEEIRRFRDMKHFILHEEESIQLAMRAALDEPRLVERDKEYLLVSDISAGSEREAAVEVTERARVQEKYHDTVGAAGSVYLGGDMDRGIYGRYAKAYTRLDKKAASRRVQSRPGGIYAELYSRGHL